MAPASEHAQAGPSKRRPNSPPEPNVPRKRQKSVIDTTSYVDLADSSSEVAPSPTASDFNVDLVTFPFVDISSPSEEEARLQNARQSRLLKERRVLSLLAEQPASDTEMHDHSIPGTPIAYEETDDELFEDDNLQIIGETDPEELSEGSTNGEKSDVPVRVLDDFTIYDKQTRQMIPVGVLMQLKYSSTTYGASGLAKAWVDDGEDEDEDDVVEVEEVDEQSDETGQRVQLSEILEFDVHHFSERKRKLDSKIYIRTKFAWYILDTPSKLYLSFFSAFWIQHRILHLIVSESLANPRITFESFVQSLKITPDSADAVAVAIKILGRELTKSDVESDDVKSYVIANIEELQQQERKMRIGRVPLIRFLLGDTIDYCDEDTRSKPPRKPVKRSTLTGNREKDVLKHRNQTVVTPRVGRIAQGLFELTLRVAGQASPELHEEEELVRAIEDTKAHHTDPSSMKWLEKADQVGYYISVSVDGVTYSVGDVVMVSPGTDDNAARANNYSTEGAQTTNSLGNKLWFCKICYFFDFGGQKSLHGQWFTHGSKTLLQETAHTKALFLMNSCNDMAVAAIYQKCNFRWLKIDELESDDNNPETENDFHCGLTWDEDDSSLVDLPTEEEFLEAISSCPEDEPCFSCGLKLQQETKTQPRPLPGGGLSQHGVSYHIHDFVYVKRSGSGLYQIAQIKKIRAMQSPPEVVVSIFDRYDDYSCRAPKKDGPSRHLVSDDRRLIKSTASETHHPDDLDGLCYVSHLTDSTTIDDWVQHADHYYVNQYAKSANHIVPLDPEDFLQCKTCTKARVQSLSRHAELLAKHGPLRGLELFSGAGGLGTGFELSGFVEATAAVEFSPGAAKTYQANHPNTTVYNQCSNLLLQHAIDCHEGKNPKRLLSLEDDKTPVPNMPRKGEMDFVFGGPPCQSFSGANHFKKANDIRSTLVCNMLSEVEFYEPSYFLLENVTGLLQFPLNGRQVDRALVGGIKMGVVKFIFRALIGLGYQVRVKVLQAGQYGAPQGRNRVIFWGAKRGLPLPIFPPPTHCFPKPSFYYKLATGDRLRPATRSKDPDNPHQIAPLPPVTVNDAIGDLPGFDWKNPHELSPATAQDKAEVAKRTRDLGIPSFDAELGPINNYPGYTESPYARPPQNRYQKWLRSGVKGDKVSYQYTRRFCASILERCINIPMMPNADHTDLPHKLRVKRFDGRVMTKGATIFGRIDGKSHFRTAMTTVGPTNKGSRLLHPTQKRIVSVRECARAQGFPDSYKFLSVNKRPGAVVADQYRQIGNAVPVPLAHALGMALGEVLLKMWEDKERAGSPEL